MGSFYVNVTLRGPSQEQVLKLLRRDRREAYVSPTRDGFTAVYDSEADSQDLEVLEELTRELSAELRCPAFAVLNHDDDILLYRLYEAGEKVDEYDSSPGYFSTEEPDDADGDKLPEPAGGDGARLCERMAPGADREAVEAVLRAPIMGEGGYLFAADRHAALARALGLPGFTVGCGYTYLEAGDLPAGVEEEELRRTEAD